jgi:hypothetical protein
MQTIGNHKWHQHPVFLFFIVMSFVCIFYYDSVLDKGPMSTHMWRQTDCLSMTKNFYDGAPFMEPELHMQMGDKNTTGKTAGEFPILYYTVAQIWKITGVSEMAYRIFYLCILVGGLFCFYQTLRMIFKDLFWSFFLTLLLFTSPILVVYGVSFLTDAPAFCFILISGYFLTRYSMEQKNLFFFIAMFFIALAGLIKVSHLLFFGFLIAIFVLEIFPVKTLGNRKFFKKSWQEYAGLIFVIGAIYSWYSYAAYYNETHGFKYTFNDIFPIWLMEEEKIEPWIKGIKEVTTHTFFGRPILFSFLFLGLFNLTLWKKIPRFAYFGNLFIILGAIAYFCLWGPLFINHDYYYLALLVLFPAIILPFVYFIKTNHSTIFNGIYTKLFLGIFLLFHLVYCKQMIALKTTAEEGYFVFVGNQRYIEEMRWINWEAKQNWMRFRQCIPYMEKLGIKQEDRIISLPDFSFSISLYLMDHKGWSNYLNYSQESQIQELVDKGAKYLVISQPEIEKQPFLEKFVQNQIGEFKGLKFYKL